LADDKLTKKVRSRLPMHLAPCMQPLLGVQFACDQCAGWLRLVLRCVTTRTGLTAAQMVVTVAAEGRLLAFSCPALPCCHAVLAGSEASQAGSQAQADQAWREGGHQGHPQECCWVRHCWQC
jgi:hypothetical protein